MSVATIGQPPPSPGRRLSVSASTWASDKAKHITVSASGEVDACNAKEFAVSVCEAVDDARRVTLDLSEVQFFAFDGVAALHAVNAHLSRAGVPWCVLAGTPVTRVLGLCDPERLIPLAEPQGPAPARRASLRLVETA
ncbi:STAS domain-containing protein [Mycobacterium sp. IDR2000157661]|uniref:STAS domain-containing protein n=1 Tax=Mycobacterium sp. IDR2000157661 TaxID=2867005 RepID=UPI001EEA18BB|nr:STAS domain-containing protein [Mycobacterium sp. IDR2000157661]